MQKAQKETDPVAEDETNKIGMLEMTRVITMDDVFEIYRLHPGISPEESAKSRSISAR